MNSTNQFLIDFLQKGALTLQILLGLTCIPISIYLKHSQYQFMLIIKDMSPFIFLQYTIQTIGIIAIVLCMIGGIGFKQNQYKKSYSIAFIFSNTILATCLITGLILVKFNWQHASDNYIFSTCDNETLKIADELYQQSSEFWCKVHDSTQSSHHDQTQNYISQDEQQDQHLTYSGCLCQLPSKITQDQELEMKKVGLDGFNENIGFRQVLQCPNFKNKYESQWQDILRYSKQFNLIEREYSCSGFCQNQVIYFFSDVSRGVPTNSKGCFESLGNRFLDQIDLVFEMSVFLFIVLLFNAILASISIKLKFKKQIKSVPIPLESLPTEMEEKQREVTPRDLNAGYCNYQQFE